MAFEDEHDTVIDVTEPEDQEEGGEEGSQESGDSGGEEFAIEIEGEDSAEEPPLVKQLRDEIRSRDRELANYRKTQVSKIEVGDKPTLEGCDFLDEKYEQELSAWYERKAQADAQERESQEAERVRNETQQQRFIQYRAAATALPVKDFQEAEASVIAALPELHQSALLAYTKDTAKIVYALAKHPAKLEALAKEGDPIKFVLAVTEMERNLKVVNRAKPPAPEAETIQRGTASSAPPSGDKKLDNLRKEAERTGDYSKVVAYKKSLK